MSLKVYTIYWINERDGVKKQHGSYRTEEDAVRAIETWWEIHKEHYDDVQQVRTNTGALEIIYLDKNYYYRIESQIIEGKLPTTSYKLRSKGEMESRRLQLNLDQETFLFDELAEPYRDRLIVAMADSKRAREFVYNVDGKPIVEIEDYMKLK